MLRIGRLSSFRSLPITRPLRLAYQPFRVQVAAMTSITAAVKDDHEEMEEYYEKVINSDDADTKTRYGNQFVWELARHAVGEELVVYPAMEKHLGEEGKAWVAEDRQEHHKASCQIFIHNPILSNT